MGIIKAVAIWLFRKETLSNAIFAVNIARAIFTSKDAKNLNKNNALLRKLKIAQEAIDNIQGFLPNDETEKYVKGINENKDEKTWGDFTATLSKDKHGQGRNGIDLGLKTKALGVPIDISYDPKDGSAKGKIGPFGFSV